MQARRLFYNAGWLATIQFLNVALPLVTVPVVARAFGPTTFGILATITAFAAYAGLVTTFGFNFTGPRTIVALRDDPKALSNAISEIVVAQMALAGVAALLFALATPWIPFALEYKAATALILIQATASSLTPQWTFLGLDCLRGFTMSQATIRIVASAAILLMIRSINDFLLYVLINSASSILTFVVAICILRTRGIAISTPRFNMVLRRTREATGLFISTLAINLYTTTSVVIVSLVLGPNAAGLYALAEKVRLATSGMIDPITTAIYPFMCRIGGKEETAAEMRTKRIFFKTIICISFFISVSLFTFSPVIIQIVGGGTFAPAIPVLRITAFTTILIALSNIVAVQTMIPIGMDREVTAILLAAAVISITSTTILSSLLGLKGAALTLLSVEAFVTIAAILVVRRRQPPARLFFGPITLAEK